MIRWVIALVSLGLGVSSVVAADPPRKTENVIWVMIDGLRWQEVFSGAEESLLNKERGGVTDVARIRKEFWRDTPAERRTALLPFIWGVMATDGQIFGNPSLGSAGRVTNGKNFSYPGYNEILCGYPDPAVISNAKIRNRNVTVLEWLHAKPGLSGKVAAFTSWDVFPYIINSERSKIPVNAGLVPLTEIPANDEVRLLNRLIAETPLEGDDTRPDSFTYHAARLYVAQKKPRILFLSFDETDSQAHNGRYDRVLGSARKNDRFIADLWQFIQTMPEYRGKTTLIVTTDHGRGDPPTDWKSHGIQIKGSEGWWAAVLGPDTPAMGDRKDVGPLTQSQIAATVAGLLGYDYRADVPKAGAPLPGVLPTAR